MAQGLATHADYRAYLHGMHAFVASVVPQVIAHAAAWRWPLPDWQASLARDLDAVAPGWIGLEAEAGAPLEPDAAAGALYVMEGSALGARTLLRDAVALGHDAAHGATFLHAHAVGGRGRRWSRFLTLLEDLGRGLDRRKACAAAEQTFQVAERCFARARDLTA